MRIILLEDIENLGKKFDIKKVNDGYARNFLLPKKIAVPATKERIKEIEALKEVEIKKAEQELGQAEELAHQLEGLIIEIPAKIGKDGKLYGGISPQKISKALEEKGFNIDKKKIIIKEPIKEIGEYFVYLNLAHNLEARISIVVIEETLDK